MFIILFLWALGRITSQGNYGVIGCLDEPQSLAETADSPVPPEPGWRVDFACSEPGPLAEAGNQTSGACIPTTWFSLLQATNQTLSRVGLL